MSNRIAYPDDRLLSMKEVVAYLNNVISRASIYREMEDKRLAYVRIRSRRYVWLSELRRYLQTRDEAA